MHRAGGVDVAQRLHEPPGEEQQRVLRQRAVVLGHHLVQGGTGEVAGGDPRHGTLGVGVRHGRGPLAAHAAGGGDLLGETLPEGAFPGQGGLDGLDGDRPSALRTREADLARPALAEPAEQPVAADGPRVLGIQRSHARFPFRTASSSRRQDRQDR